MSFKAKVQKIILETVEDANWSELRGTFLKQIVEETNQKIEEELFPKIMENLENWKEKTIRVAVKEVLEDMKKKGELKLE